MSGVLGGLESYTGIDATLLRLGYALATVFTAIIPFAFIYIICAIIIPLEPEHNTSADVIEGGK